MAVESHWNVPLLAVEDDPLIGEMIQLRLNASGFRVSLAKTGRAGLDLAGRVSPSMILLDLGLPDISGFEILAELRKQRMLAAVPVLVLTARHAQDDVRKALSLGANDFIAKPFEFPHLIKRIMRLLVSCPTSPRLRPAPSGAIAL